jgi:hypothetical protein
MTNTVTLTNLTAGDAIAVKWELERTGLTVDQDFTWAYQPVKYTAWSNDPEPSQATFDFRDAALASFYRLKWTK